MKIPDNVSHQTGRIHRRNGWIKRHCIPGCQETLVRLMVDLKAIQRYAEAAMNSTDGLGSWVIISCRLAIAVNWLLRRSRLNERKHEQQRPG
jgi:hypothetical protein